MKQTVILARHYEQAMSEVLPGRSPVVDIAISLIKERAADLAQKEIDEAENTPSPSSENTLKVWFGEMPESNGRSNWTAILYKGRDMMSGITIARSEYKDRVRYEADRVRYIIGELPSEPDILEYDGNLHSGYGRNKVEFIPVDPSDGGNCD